jgi:hypothetical protein
MRLERSRRGKTPIDVNVVIQDGLPRVRLTVGAGSPNAKNSDLDFEETDALVTVLRYHLARAKGEIPND